MEFINKNRSLSVPDNFLNADSHQNYISGTDGGKFDWMKVRSREGDIMECKFYEVLDNNSEEIGRECTINEISI